MSFPVRVVEHDLQRGCGRFWHSTWITGRSRTPRCHQKYAGNSLAAVWGSIRMTSNHKSDVRAPSSNSSPPLPSTARVHVLGIGNIGRLFAHGLAVEDIPPRITLLLHRTSLAESWESGGRAIEIVADGVSSKSSGYEIEIIGNNAQGEGGTINNLIVATKATNTATAILAIKDRLSPSSAILFTQNGMGIVDEVSHKVFPDVATRPTYLACVTSHGIYSQGPFNSVHAGFGTVAIGKVASQQDSPYSEDISTPPSGLVEAIIRAPILAAREVSSVELFQLQLEKLAVNAMINPLTVVFNRRNGELFTDIRILKMMRLLLQETSEVIRSLPELQDDPAAQERFSEARLDAIVLDMAEKTARNTSSMLQDVRAGRQTEIDYINGYIVGRGTQVGIDCSNNRKLIQLVKEPRTMSEDEIQQLFLTAQ